ncbi:MAG: ABC transporter ATP-binding protein [Bdellovibrionales bacterium]
MLQLSGVSKSFNGRQVLKPTELLAAKGEFISLLGPSGCGKTTLLRLIAGLEMTDSGRIDLDNVDVTKHASHQRDVHTVFQRYALFPHLNVFDNVAFGPRCQKMPESQIQKEVTELLEMVGLKDYGNRSINTLSGGEQQRVALIRALINKPKLVLLDEPMAALDAKLRIQLQGELVSIQKRFGITFVYVTHDQQEALNMSDRIAIMNRGHIEQVGTPLEVYETPKNYFVAQFIGTIHSLSGVIQGQTEKNRSVEVAGEGVFFCENTTAPVGTQGLLCVRPEKLVLTKRKPSSENILAAKVKHLTYLGTHTVAEVITARGVSLSVFQQNLERKIKREMHVGDSVFVSWSSQHCHFFEKPQ